MSAMLWCMDKRGPITPGSIIHVVDSDTAVREGLEILLQGMAGSIRAYPDAEAFLAGLPNVGPPGAGLPGAGLPGAVRGCLIVEVNLPGMSGLELIERLRELNVRLPVIVLASFSDVPTAVRAMRAGALDFIDKPFVDRILRARVHQALTHAGVST